MRVCALDDARTMDFSKTCVGRLLLGTVLFPLPQPPVRFACSAMTVQGIRTDYGAAVAVAILQRSIVSVSRYIYDGFYDQSGAKTYRILPSNWGHSSKRIGHGMASHLELKYSSSP